MSARRPWPYLLALLPLAAPACGRSQGATAQGPGGGPPRPAGLRVRVAPVEARDVTYQIKALGSLEAEELVQVTAEVEGAVASVHFHEGDRVTPGTVLARIDPERYRLEAERAEATYKKAVADAQRARSEFERRERLAAEQLVAAEELLRARQEAERLAAEGDAAKAAWDIALQNRRRSEVRPPRAGVVNTKSVETGQFVRTGTVLATIVDVNRLRLRFKLSEAESLRAREGQTVTFRVASLGERDFPARIYHVGEVADPATRQVEVMAWVRNTGELTPGFFAEVTVPAESRQGALVVPEGAIQASEQGFVAYVVEGDTARMRPVQIGLRTADQMVEIVSGLRPGEVVVIEGSDRLNDGTPVQPVRGDGGGAAAGRAQGGTR